MSAPIAMKELEEIGIFITAYYFKQLEHRKRSTSSITISHDNNANNTLGEMFEAAYTRAVKQVILSCDGVAKPRLAVLKKLSGAF